MMAIRKIEQTIKSFPGLRKAALISLLVAVSATGMIQVVRARPWLVKQDPEEVVLTLSPEGFVPAEVTRGPGRFQLSVDNRSGVDDLTLNLRGSDGTQLRQIKAAPGSDWSELLDLAPGSYALSEASHSNWVCFFTIRSQEN